MKIDRKVRLRVEELESRVVPSTVAPPPTPPAPYALWNSSNWSGIDLDTTKGAVTAVSGSWVVPAVTSSGTGYSSAWVGIDGDLSSTVEQIGTESDTRATSVHDGTPQYYAWYEMYPAGYYYTTPRTVNPGDQITASVVYVGQTKSGTKTNDNFQLTIADLPIIATVKPWTFTTTQSVPSHQIAQRTSAEWIQEAPSGSSVLPLANFGSITFTNAQATISGATGTIASFVGKPSIVNYGTSTTPLEINLMDMGTVNRSGQWTSIKDETSLLNSSGDSFTVQFGSSNPAAPSGLSSTKGLNDRMASLADLQVTVPNAGTPAGSGPNVIVVEVSLAIPGAASTLNPVAANETIVQPGFRPVFSQPEGAFGRSGVVGARMVDEAGNPGAGLSWFGLPLVHEAAVPLVVTTVRGSATTGGQRSDLSAKPFATTFSPIEQPAMVSPPTLVFSEDAHIDRLVGTLALVAFLPSLQMPKAKEEPARVRRLPGGNGLPE